MVVDLDDLVATLEMGPDAEEWVFPRSMLPGDIEIDSVLTFDGIGSAGHGRGSPPAGSVGRGSHGAGPHPPRAAPLTPPGPVYDGVGMCDLPK